jgi:hypothetical protein
MSKAVDPQEYEHAIRADRELREAARSFQDRVREEELDTLFLNRAGTLTHASYRHYYFADNEWTDPEVQASITRLINRGLVILESKDTGLRIRLAHPDLYDELARTP